LFSTQYFNTAVVQYGEMTSQNLWSQDDRHFVGITRGVNGRRFSVLFK